MYSVSRHVSRTDSNHLLPPFLLGLPIGFNKKKQPYAQKIQDWGEVEGDKRDGTEREEVDIYGTVQLK